MDKPQGAQSPSEIVVLIPCSYVCFPDCEGPSDFFPPVLREL